MGDIDNSRAEHADRSLHGAAEAHPLRRDDFDRDVWCVLGLPVDIAEIDRVLAEIDDAARSGRRLSFVTPNVNWLVRALKDRNARAEILAADLSVVDGAPLVAIARTLGIPIRSRVAGSDVFEALRRRPGFGGRKLRVFFFGGRDGAAAAACDALARERGGVEPAGWLNPGYGDVDSMSTDAIIAEINAANADFVLVSLGAAKGQAWIEKNKARLNAPVTAHLGAVVDFTAGGVARAPRWVQRVGLEWVWRIKEEPALWRRYWRDGLSLAGILCSRLLPQFGAGRSEGRGTVEVAIERRREDTQLRLAGFLAAPDLKPVRDAFREAAARGLDCCLDLERVTGCDRAFLGQILMLEKNLARSGARIFVAGAARPLQALLRANGMDYAARPALGAYLASGAARAVG